RVDGLAAPAQAVTITVGGIGVRITSGELVVAALVAPDGTSYTAVRADQVAAELLGLPDSITLDLSGVGFEFNTRKPPTPTASPLPALDWTAALDLDNDGSFGDELDPGQ